MWESKWETVKLSNEHSNEKKQYKYQNTLLIQYAMTHTQESHFTIQTAYFNCNLDYIS